MKEQINPIQMQWDNTHKIKGIAQKAIPFLRFYLGKGIEKYGFLFLYIFNI